MDSNIAQTPLEYCPLCTTLGKISTIVPYFLNIDEAVYLCSNEHCQYPFGYDDFVFLPLSHLSTREQLLMCNSKHEEKDSDYLQEDILSALNDISSNDIPWNDSLLFSPDFCENLQFDETLFGSSFEEQSSNVNKDNIKQTNFTIEENPSSIIHTTPEKNSDANIKANTEEKPTKKISILSDIKLPNFSTLAKNDSKELKCKSSNDIISVNYGTKVVTPLVLKNQTSHKIEMLTSVAKKEKNTLVMSHNSSRNKTENNATKIVSSNNAISTNFAKKVLNFSQQQQQRNINKSITNIEYLCKSSASNTKGRTQISNPIMLKKMRMLQSSCNRNAPIVKKNTSNNLSEPVIAKSNNLEQNRLLSDIKISYLTPADNQGELLTLSFDLNDISNSNLLPLSNFDIGEVVKGDNSNEDSSKGTNTSSPKQSVFDNLNSIINLDSLT